MRPAGTILLPRALIFLASVWLIGTWLLAIGVRPPVHPTASSYEPGVRLMIVCLATGLMIGWPLLRLSQSAPAAPRRQTLLDLIVLLAMMQVILWPMRLVTSWPPIRTAAIDATLTGWACLAGATIAAAVTTDRRGPRNLAMLGCVAMCMLGPVLAVISTANGVAESRALQLVELSPLLTARSLGMESGPVAADQWQWIGLLGVAALAVWIVLGLTALRKPGRT